jgi:hypothetical protein
MKWKVTNIIITLVVAFVVYYVTLPAINLNNPGFYVFLGFVAIFYSFLDLGIRKPKLFYVKKGTTPKKIKVKDIDGLLLKTIAGCFGVFVVILIVNLICSPLFNAKKYQTRISVDENGDFAKDIKEVDFNQLPLLDKDSSSVLGDRVMGEMADLVSQYNVSSLYTQINYNDEIIRVTPLEYADEIKWLTNRDKGIVGYITVNSVTGESKLIKLDKGMKYSDSALFNDNLVRKLRFSYPTTNFGKISFEIDNDGNPYYIVPTIKYTAVGLRAKVTGVIIFDPITGNSKKYKLEDVPTWVDIAYSASLIIEQVDDWGTYKNGFWNSIFGQKNVVNTTEGYNYLAMEDDIYLYTGITSVVSDESNLGFILTNMRTGKTTYYSVPGAEEYSAMNSAQGQVQDLGYHSTFPLLINLKGRPTYLVSLKDNSGLVKMYGFVDVRDYQKVSVTDSSKGIIKAKDNYLASIKKEAKDDELVIKEIKVDSINTSIINGYTYYYISSGDNKYKISISLSDKLPFVKVGDTIKIGYYETESDIIEVEKYY